MTQQGNLTTEVRIAWQFQRDGRKYMGLVNVGMDAALEVEVDWVLRWEGQRDQPVETRRADLVPPGTGVWHNATPLPDGTDPSRPRQVMWEVRWTHPYGERHSIRMDEPVEL